MSWYRWLLCAVLCAVADGAWLFLLLGLLGFLAGLGGSPLPWLVCEAVLIGAVFAIALADIAPSAWRARRAIAPLAGATAVWLGVAAVGPVGGERAGVAWPLRLAGDDAGAWAVAIVLAVPCCAWLWRHGAGRARVAAAAALFARGFRAGLVVFVVVLAFEAAGDLDLGTRAVLVPFFVASLAGMALARAPARGASMRGPLALVAASVAIVIAAGLGLAVVVGVVVRAGAGVVAGSWHDLAVAVTEAVGATLEQVLGRGSPGGGLDFVGLPADPPEAIVVAVLLAGAAVVGFACNRMFSAQLPRWPQFVLDLAEEEREWIEDRDSPHESALFDALRPRWLGRRRKAAPAPRLPAEPGIAEVFALYHRMLELARARGVALDPAQTPFERARGLLRALPDAPVDALTRRFVAACYGGMGAPADVVASLRRDLERAAGGARR